MPNKLNRTAGKSLFAGDVDAYDLARPEYPNQLFQFILDSVGSPDDLKVLEIGAGNGLASKHLLQLGIRELTLVEPDSRFEPTLELLKSSTRVPVTLVSETFERAALASAHYDLVLAATSFHWLDPETRLKKIARSLKPDGHLVLIWNVFGDANQPDPFHDATQHLFGRVLISPSQENLEIPFALDIDARLGEFEASYCFNVPKVHRVHWSLTLTSEKMLALYRTFSGVNSLSASDREELLAGLESVANEQFDGTVIRNMTSIAYVATRSVTLAE